MKIYLVGLAVLALMFGMVLLSSATEKSNDLILGISTDKESYAKGDPVYCTLMLVNVGTQPIVVNKRLAINRDALFPHEVLFYVTGPEGKLLNFIPMVTVSIYPKLEEFTTLYPSRFVRRTLELSEFFSLEKEGKYTIQAVYENYYEPAGMMVWQGKIASNKVEIEVRR
ncbi:hypothetical protein IBX65_00980 [Candidatus Aerophobetes bacterium]|nr:hypothetical protein [Candidatus Aerophobetes bacterium]